MPHKWIVFFFCNYAYWLTKKWLASSIYLCCLVNIYHFSLFSGKCLPYFCSLPSLPMASQYHNQWNNGKIRNRYYRYLCKLWSSNPLPSLDRQQVVHNLKQIWSNKTISIVFSNRERYFHFRWCWRNPGLCWWANTRLCCTKVHWESSTAG